MKDISNFNNTNDYLPLLNSILIIDLIYLAITFHTKLFKSKYLKKWYQDYRLSAIIADCSIIFLAFVFTRFIYTRYNVKWSLLKFTILSIVVQVVHDILFYKMFMYFNKNTNKMLDLFKDYAKELSFYAILGDTSMMIFISILTSLIANLNYNTNIIILTTLVYISQYLIYAK